MHKSKVFWRGIAALFAWFALANSQASAGEDAIPWAKVGAWGIRFDPSLGGCFMVGSWTQGEVVRIGIDSERKTGYLMIANEKWRSVQEGNKYELRFQFDAETPWRGDSRGIKMGTATFLLVKFHDATFFKEFATKNVLVISYGDRVVTRLPLTGSLAAMQSVIQCQGQVDSVVAGQTDPFSNREAVKPSIQPKKPDDPFSGSRGRRASSDPFEL
jgi:hypothetical protein